MRLFSLRRPESLACFVCLAIGTLAGCGGASAPLPPAEAAHAPPQDSGSATSAGTSGSAQPKAAATPPESDSYDDPEEAKDPQSLTPLLDSTSKPAFPKATVGEHECWQTVSPTGDSRKDYDAIIARRGGPTGAIEYVKPATGKLHYKLDKRDTFIVPLRGGLCYRFFGVADSTIKDIDILIERPGGALVGDDKTVGPVAIIESEKAWCMGKDGVYDFLVEIDGEGQGRYVFGVWARAKP
jgi:hypothetical protein